MGTTLASHATDRRTLRTVLGWTLFGASLLIESAGLYLGLHDRSDAGLVLVFGGMALGPIGFSVLPGGRLDEIQGYYQQDRATGRPASMVRDDVETRWLWAARSERRWRRFGGWAELVGGLSLLGLGGALVAVETKQGANNASMLALEGGLLLAGGLDVGWGVHLLTSDGPVESAFHANEQALGRSLWKGCLTGVGPRFSLAPGGGVLGVGGRF
jgi:hypothetical protein